MGVNLLISAHILFRLELVMRHEPEYEVVFWDRRRIPDLLIQGKCRTITQKEIISVLNRILLVQTHQFQEQIFHLVSNRGSASSASCGFDRGLLPKIPIVLSSLRKSFVKQHLKILL
ncbi:hypothetical protein RIF29_29735 [Crotalaria pallida]|uniref:Uncharacterized protein n=1 Tax=Crotalaria pallida TaxID=3830 RepID=A0AAN9EFZ9_CROPI